MEFIETPTFTRLVVDLLADKEYSELQNALVEYPEQGDIIRGGGGIRKLRRALAGCGNSGEVRIIYYWIRNDKQIYMLLLYPKSKKTSLTGLAKQALFDQLLQATKEAKAIARGETAASRRIRVTQPDVKTVRERLGLSQIEFAQFMRVSVKTVQNWEQHHVYPTGPAAALLKIVKAAPDFVLKAMRA